MRQSGPVAGAATLLAVSASIFANALAVDIAADVVIEGVSPSAGTTVVPSLLRAAIAGADRTVDVPIDAGGRSLILRIAPHSLRSEGFRVLAAAGRGAPGELIEVDAPAPRTFIGTVLESPGSIVRAAAVDGGVVASFSVDGERWFVQPVDDAGTHAVFSHDDIEPADGHCGVVDDAQPKAPPAAPAGGGIAGFNCQRLTEIAIDADFEFYQANGSSVNSTVADIENILNGVIGIYNAECDLDFVITEIIVRSDSNDPYTTGVASDLLLQFAEEWIFNQPSIPRDVAHLFTGKNLVGSTIGIAFTPGVCNPSAQFGLSQSKWSGVYANRVSVTTHEIGHNFSAFHCNGQPDCGVMCASVNGCAGSGIVFGPTSAAQITSYADGSTCLGPGSPAFVNASDGTVCDQVSVTFALVPDAASHTVYRAVDSGDPAQAVVVQTNATSPYVDTNVTLGALYGYWVTATRCGGLESNLGDADFGFAPTQVAAPTFVAATDGTQCGQVVIVWNVAPNAASYELWRGTTSDPAQSGFLADDTGSPHSDTTAVPGQLYFYWVRSANGCGEPGPFGANDSGSRKAPPAAANPSATDDECPGVTISWSAAAGATSSTLWRGTTSDPAQAAILQPNATSPFVDDTVAAGTTFWYFVQSLNTCGGGELGAGDAGTAVGGAADLTGDCIVDGADLGILLGNWGGAGAGDLDGDGIVDGADLGLLLGSWS